MFSFKEKKERKREKEKEKEPYKQQTSMYKLILILHVLGNLMWIKNT